MGIMGPTSLPLATVPFGLYEPDKASFNPIASNIILNARPVADGWGPLASFVEVSAALPSAPRGAFFARDSGGSFHTFVGTETNLYELDTSTDPYSWTEISKTTGAYTLDSGHKWSAAQYGDVIYFAHQGDVLQSFDMISDTIVSDVSGSPQAKFVFVAGDHVVCANLVSQPDYMYWSAANGPTVWTIGRRGCDDQRLPFGGEITGAIGDPRGFLVTCRNAIFYMSWQPGSTWTFVRSVANPARGCLSPYSLRSFNPGQFAYLAEDGFFIGAEGQPIGSERVNDYFFDEIDEDYYADVQCALDPFKNILWWRYFNQDAMNVMLGYNWELNRWTYSDTQIVDIVSTAKAAVTWDGLDALYGSIDAATAAFGSNLFLGGQPTLAGFTTNNKLAFQSGANQAATLETNWVELTKGRRTFVSGGFAMCDADSMTAQIAASDTYALSGAFGSAKSQEDDTGMFPFLSEGRLHKVRLNIAAGATWKTAANMQLIAQEAGDA